MLTSYPIVASTESVDAAKVFLRLDGDADDGVIAALIVAAMAQCDAFTATVQVDRAFAETLMGGAAWSCLTAWPVVAIVSVTTPDTIPLAVGSYETDIGPDGKGRVRLTGVPPQPVKVGYRAGLASGWTAIAEPVRHGIVRLAAHHYATRDRDNESGVPEAVTALWHSARRMRLS